jgi:hypothetical protein
MFISSDVLEPYAAPLGLSPQRAQVPPLNDPLCNQEEREKQSPWLLRSCSRERANGEVHFVATTVYQKGFLAIDGVPRPSAVRKPRSVRFLDDVYHFDWFDDGEATQSRSHDDPVARRYRTWGVHDKPTRGFHFPKKHLKSDTLPNSVAASDECRHF